jgi:hypothetical protein
MGTKSRERIYGSFIRASAERAREAQALRSLRQNRALGQAEAEAGRMSGV